MAGFGGAFVTYTFGFLCLSGLFAQCSWKFHLQRCAVEKSWGRVLERSVVQKR